ncbi:Winged helix DNA-binding domain-containing protein [Pseudomonas sp. NFACC24-1]|uniref:winged helix DNA-binding protein n=1 Tax=Pseudomonas sp. NFACC24-1 TaxID=1566189 RepID=UPI0008F3A882|nr:winged helix DNA-binding protein [Pseudomonas sp. NFACC24-1]SFN51168.1 Winged helix DNA-binding domain-containing protein [Pseudomonas sp. NFACC24-1]
MKKTLFWMLDKLLVPVLLLFVSKEWFIGVWGAIFGPDNTWFYEPKTFTRWQLLLALSFIAVFFIWHLLSTHRLQKKIRTLTLTFAGTETESKDIVRLATMSLKEAQTFEQLYKLPLGEWLPPSTLNNKLGLNDDQAALGYLESLRSRKLALRKNYTKPGHPLFKLSAEGRRLAIEQRKELDDILLNTKLTTNQALVLRRIAEMYESQQKADVRTLATQTSMPPLTMEKIIEHLEKKKLITHVLDISQGAKYYSPTPAGRDFL